MKHFAHALIVGAGFFFYLWTPQTGYQKIGDYSAEKCADQLSVVVATEEVGIQPPPTSWAILASQGFCTFRLNDPVIPYCSNGQECTQEK